MSAPRQAWMNTMNTPSPMKINNNNSELRETSLPPKERYKRKRKQSMKQPNHHKKTKPQLQKLIKLYTKKNKNESNIKQIAERSKETSPNPKEQKKHMKQLEVRKKSLMKLKEEIDKTITKIKIGHPNANVSNLSKVENLIANIEKKEKEKEKENENKKQEKEKQKNERRQKVLKSIGILKKEFNTLKNRNNESIYSNLGQGRELFRVTKTSLNTLNKRIQKVQMFEQQKTASTSRSPKESYVSLIKIDGKVVTTPEVIYQFLKIKDLIIELRRGIGNNFTKLAFLKASSGVLKKIHDLFPHSVEVTNMINEPQEVREIYYKLSDIKSEKTKDFRRYLKDIRNIITDLIPNQSNQNVLAKKLDGIIEYGEKYLAQQNKIYYKVISFIKYNDSFPIRNKTNVIYDKLNSLKTYTNGKPKIQKDIRLNLDWGQQLDHDPISVSSFVPFLQSLNGSVFSPNSMFYYLLYRSIIQGRCKSCPLNAKECRGLCDLVLPRSAITVPSNLNGEMKEVYNAYGALVHGILSYDKVRTGVNTTLGITSGEITDEQKLLVYLTKSQSQAFRDHLIEEHDMRYGCYVFDDNRIKAWLPLDMKNMLSFFKDDAKEEVDLYYWKNSNFQTAKRPKVNNSILSNYLKDQLKFKTTLKIEKDKTGKTFKQLCIEKLFPN